MGYSTPPTVSTNDPLLASDWNTYVKGNLDYFYSLIPATRVYNNANISCTGSTDNAITFNTERYDTDTMHSTSSNTSRLIATTAGVYAIGFNGEWSTTPATYEVEIWVNNTTKIAWMTGTQKRFSLNTQYKLSAADYVEVIINPATTQTLLATAAYSPEFFMTRVAAG